MRNKILILNLGSTSIKGSIFKLDNDLMSHEKSFSEKLDKIRSPEEFILSQINDQAHLLVIGFRVVHGGKNYVKPMQIDDDLLRGIAKAEILAPLHNAIFIHWYQVIKSNFSIDIPLIACFDSSFFYHLPELSKAYPIAPQISEKFGIQKLGFHGFAHQSILSQVKENEVKKVITMQLGGGCSITASMNGKPIETSMGFTPLEGLMMGTRSGNIDPGIIFYLLKCGLLAKDIEDILNHQSGLKGIVGTDDLQKITAMKTDESVFALNLFCRSIAKFLGSYITLLGGVDVIVFGGGIGENSALVRKNVMDYLKYAGIFIDEKLNQSTKSNFQKISTIDSQAEVYIIKPNEELEMAKEVQKMLKEVK